MAASSISRSSPPKKRLLILESGARVLAFLGRALEGTYQVSLYAESEAFLAALATNPSDLAVMAWDSAELSLASFTRFRELQPTMPLLVLSCSSQIEDYSLFSRLNSRGVLLKPFTEEALRDALEAALPSLLPAFTVKPPLPINEEHSFVRSSRRMLEIEAQATLVARSDVPVLILGESGTGKEVLALFTHNRSLRSKRMFLKINCAAMPAELLESELFGYEQGAFTGALKTKPGKFETCDGGTIFLDEIGEMPAILQAKLLQVLQDGTFSRLGSRTSMRTDVRIIAATNINMKEAMQRKTFREDLYYRLNGLSLVLPPLRERIEEVPVFAEYFIAKSARKHGLQPLPLSPTLVRALCQYHWPGNLRELENVINRFLILRDEGAILAELSNSGPAPNGRSSPGFEGESHSLKALARGVKGEAESFAIEGVLEKNGWNRKAAASALQISYKALLYKIKQYELVPK